MNTNFQTIQFNMPKNTSNVIKVIGVGGGGSNVVNHMFAQGLEGVDFVICNTDSQALVNSPVPNKIQLGATLTEGLGAGANADIGKKSAEESFQEIEEMLSSHTKMVFITAGMGGGTGTGAAPVIAKIAKSLDLLTVGIVTVPFNFEGKSRREQARKGVEEMKKYVDSMIVINNNKLRDIYGDLGYKAGFSKADEVLSTAATAIAEVITKNYTINIDLNDTKTVLTNSGTALMGSATATGKGRAKEAISTALDSPLLDDNRIVGAKNVLLLIVSGKKEVTIDEIGEINDHICSEAQADVNIIMGIGEDESMEDALSVTIVATGFDKEQQKKMSNAETSTIIHVIGEEGDNPQTTIDFDGKKDPLQKVEKPIDDTPFLPEEPSYYETLKKDKTPKEEIKEPLEKPVDEVAKPTEQIDDFTITVATTNVKNTVKIEEKPKPRPRARFYEQPSLFGFDSPISETKKPESITQQEEVKSEVVVNELEEIKETEVATEQYPDGTIVHTLTEEYIKFEEKISGAKNPEKKEETIVEEEETFTLSVEEPKQEVVEEPAVVEEPMTPYDIRISELRKTSEERKETLKNFNYKFSNRIFSEKIIEEYENQPAYKRMGIELEEVPSLSQQGTSRTTLSIDEDNDINLRSNNSFLHDNVD